MNKKILTISMVSIITLNVFPVNIFKKETKAASFVSNVSKIENPVAGGSGGNWSGNYVYFGNYMQSSSSTKEPIRWRVLDNNNTVWTGSTGQSNGFAYNIGYGDKKGGRQNAPVGGNGMLLYSDLALDEKQYHPTPIRGNEKNGLCWGGNGGGSGKGCTLWAWLNGYGNGSVWLGISVPGSPFLTNAFSSAEQNVIMSTKVYSEDLIKDRNGATTYAGSARTSLTQDKIFLPSYNEMLNTSYGFTNTRGSSNTRSFVFSNYPNNLKQYVNSWLRSPGIDTYEASAACLSSGGYISNDGFVDCTFAVCPAFNLNLASVIFASEAAESGASGAEGDGKKSSVVSSTPTRFSLPTGKGNDYKLTLKDSNRSFSASKTAQNGNQVTISYNGAKTGSNEYISCLILDNNDKSNIRYYGKLKQANSTSGTVTLDMPQELAYGEYTVEIFNEQYNGAYKTDFASDFSEFTAIVKYIPTVTELTAKTLTYNKSAQELVNAGSTTGGTLQYKLNNGSWQTNIPTATNAGNYTVYYKVVGNNEYLDVAEKSVSVTIKKATPNVKAPTAKENFVYDSEQKGLVNAGSTDAGTLQYKEGNGTYSTNIPTKTDAGTYKVYYKVVGDSNYDNVAEKSFNVTIAKATPNVTPPTAKEDLVYDSEQKELVNAGRTDAGTLKYSLSDKVYSEDIPTGTNAGTYDVYYKVEGNNNYNNVAEDKLSVTIAKADPIITAPTARDLTYNGDPQELVEAGSTTGGTLEYSLNNNESYSTKIPTGMIADTYTVYYRVIGDDNYNSISEESLKVTIIIDKAIPDSPPAPKEKSKSRYSITLKPLEPNENGAKPEYKMLNGKSIFEATPASQNKAVLKLNILAQENESEYKSNDETPWQESNVFKNLIPNKEYTFYSRYVATEDGNFAPSLPSEPIKIRTLKKSSQLEEEIEDNKNTNNESDETIKANRNEVGISDKIQQIETENGIANIETKRSGDDIEVKITDENGNPITIEDGIVLVVECNQDGSGIVAATINDDGTIEKVIRKSVVKDGKIYIPLNCSAKIRIIDNSKLFYDVFANHWAYDAVNFVSAHELFNGTAQNIFEPETPMSRAMMVQVLHNLEDNPKQAFEKIFSDVNFDDWFAEAVTWGATHRGTIIGYDDGRFGPNDNITREQLATILYRYFGENEIVDTDLNFVDADQISNYALKAVQWAVKYKIIQGKGNNILDPQGLATRAEVAQMFQNLMLNLFYR